MAEYRVPSMLLHTMLTEVESMMGRRSLIMLLRQAGLPQYEASLPPEDDSPSITVEQYSQLLANIYEIFGARGAKPIFLRGGRIGATKIRSQRPARFALAGTALKLLPVPKRMEIILGRLCEEGEELYGTPHHLHPDAEGFTLEMPDCPYCAEIARRTAQRGLPATKPVCHIPLAVIEEMVEWAAGAKHPVEEVECIAMGAPACKFRVAK